MLYVWTIRLLSHLGIIGCLVIEYYQFPVEARESCGSLGCIDECYNELTQQLSHAPKAYNSRQPGMLVMVTIVVVINTLIALMLFYGWQVWQLQLKLANSR